jgi:hypothetical protein
MARWNPPHACSWNPPTNFVVNVIFDPCRNRAYDCCDQMFGTPEYVSPIVILDMSALNNYITVNENWAQIIEAER